MDAKLKFRVTRDGRLMIGDTLLACLYFTDNFDGTNRVTMHIMTEKKLEVSSSSAFIELYRSNIE